jgi:hypothetical protein
MYFEVFILFMKSSGPFISVVFLRDAVSQRKCFSPSTQHNASLAATRPEGNNYLQYVLLTKNIFPNSSMKLQ